MTSLGSWGITVLLHPHICVNNIIPLYNNVKGIFLFFSPFFSFRSGHAGTERERRGVSALFDKELTADDSDFEGGEFDTLFDAGFVGQIDGDLT